MARLWASPAAHSHAQASARKDSLASRAPTSCPGHEVRERRGRVVEEPEQDARREEAPRPLQEPAAHGHGGEHERREEAEPEDVSQVRGDRVQRPHVAAGEHLHVDEEVAPRHAEGEHRGDDDDRDARPARSRGLQAGDRPRPRQEPRPPDGAGVGYERERPLDGLDVDDAAEDGPGREEVHRDVAGEEEQVAPGVERPRAAHVVAALEGVRGGEAAEGGDGLRPFVLHPEERGPGFDGDA